MSHNVTCYVMSHNVTQCYTMSRNVTYCYIFHQSLMYHYMNLHSNAFRGYEGTRRWSRVSLTASVTIERKAERVPEPVWAFLEKELTPCPSMAFLCIVHFCGRRPGT